MIVIVKKVDGRSVFDKQVAINAGIENFTGPSYDRDRYLGTFSIPGTDLGQIPTSTYGRNALGATLPAEIIQNLGQLLQ